MVDFNADGAAETASLINGSGGDAFALTADIGPSSDVSAMADEVSERFDTLGMLANNASWIVKLFLEHSEEDWRRVLDVKFTGHFLVCEALVPLMITAGDGHIVKTCSIATVQGRPNRIVYCAAKGGFLTFTRALAADLSDKNVRVNALALGMIETPMNQALADAPEVGSAWNNENLVGRCGQPDDVAKSAVFLASSDADFITGSTIQGDGGSISASVRAGEMPGR